MKLTEVFTKPKGKIKWKTKTAKEWNGEFSVGDRKFEFIALKGAVDESELHPYEDEVDQKEAWSVGFVQDATGKGSTRTAARTDITGEGKPIEVFNKALVAAKEFVKGTKPKYIYFSAKEPSRMKLYNLMVKKLASSAGFKVINASQGNYLLQNKRHR
tara:strand:- start:2961 stop:3434 length:474 start_codon:yes stop_codon:yes gene_type:complete